MSFRLFSVLLLAGSLALSAQAEAAKPKHKAKKPAKVAKVKKKTDDDDDAPPQKLVDSVHFARSKGHTAPLTAPGI